MNQNASISYIKLKYHIIMKKLENNLLVNVIRETHSTKWLPTSGFHPVHSKNVMNKEHKELF